MDCVLKKHLKKEHEEMRTPAMEEMTYICPLMDRQICMWCCLHISHIAQPITRTMTADHNAGYADKIVALVGSMDWDDVWTTCSQCGRRA